VRSGGDILLKESSNGNVSELARPVGHDFLQLGLRTGGTGCGTDS